MVPFTRTFHCCVIYCFSLCFMYTVVHCCEMCCKDYCCVGLWPCREINILLLLYRTHELHSIMPHPDPNPTPTRQPPTPNPNPQPPTPTPVFFLPGSLSVVCLPVCHKYYEEMHERIFKVRLEARNILEHYSFKFLNFVAVKVCALGVLLVTIIIAAVMVY